MSRPFGSFRVPMTVSLLVAMRRDPAGLGRGQDPPRPRHVRSVRPICSAPALSIGSRSSTTLS